MRADKKAIIVLGMLVAIGMSGPGTADAAETAIMQPAAFGDQGDPVMPCP